MGLQRVGRLNSSSPFLHSSFCSWIYKRICFCTHLLFFFIVKNKGENPTFLLVSKASLVTCVPNSSNQPSHILVLSYLGRLRSMGSLRVRHDWVTSLSLFTFMHRRRKWQPTPVFLPGESQGRGSLVGCRLWGRTESDTTEATQQQQHDRH